MSPDWSSKPEPVPYSKLDNPQTLNLYAYVGNNPLGHIDADGHDAMVVALDDYKARGSSHSGMPFTGHAILITVDSKGHTKAFEYGRYDKEKKGLVRELKTIDLSMKNGKPTAASMKALLGVVADQEHGYTGKMSAAYFKISDNNTQKVNSYAEDRMSQNSNPNRTPYSLGISGAANNCGTFARDGVAAGGVNVSAASSDIRPTSIVKDLQKSADIRIFLDPDKE